MVASALYGLQRLHNCGSASKAIRRVTQWCRELRGPLGAVGISNSLYGLREYSQTLDTRELLYSLTPRVLENVEPLTPQQLSNSLYGLITTSDTSEVRGLVVALAVAAQHCSETLPSLATGIALYGLRGLPSTLPTRRLFHTLVPLLRDAEPLEPQCVSRALNGLKSQSDTPETRLVLEALLPRIKGCLRPLGEASLSASVFGLQGQTDTAVVREILGIMASSLPNGRFHTVECTQLLQALIALAKGGVYVSPFMEAVLARRPRQAPAPLAQMLSLVGCGPPKVKQSSGGHANGTEKLLLILFRQSGLANVVKFNVTHSSGFSMDILCGNVNVELDGIGTHYHAEGKRRIFALRDAFLQSKGIKVVRINTYKMSMQALVGAIGTACGADQETGFRANCWKHAERSALVGWTRFARATSNLRKNEKIWAIA
eukprot:TRINITY_DN13993_c0_g1_i4.p1 TRINITY_DN13993_c0_g1~~TRINITY_DN13993_c0_g1_i4.p1  ORF type:complete len:430 (+),score=86.49 TRINITY_DN13993_c0_g1_i4:926-2215(+)